MSFGLVRGYIAGKLRWGSPRGLAVQSLEPRLLFAVGSPYSVPANPETVVNLDPGWVFQLYTSGSSSALASPTLNTSSWTSVTLPHTWDPNSTGVQTGDGWYRQTVTIPSSMIGNEIYIQFQGACLSATVYVDGNQVGTHNGGWEAFDVDVTSAMTAGSHLVAVDVNNNTNANIPPASGGDYTKEGGLYRSVSLLAVNKSHVALTEPVISPDTSGNLVAGSGVYFSNSTVTMGISSATINVSTVLDNLSASSAPLTVTSYLVDAGGIIRAQQSSAVTMTAGQLDDTIAQSASVANPHLWDGRADPYLYDLYVQVANTSTGQIVDLNHQQVGIRSMTLSASTGFYLNGASYQLVGVNMHQDSGAPSINGGVAGWAQTDAQQDNDINQAVALGATIIRTAHYQRDPGFYSYCDQVGMIIETEWGLQNSIASTTAGSPFVNTSEDMLTELIRQNYNHPSIVFWSLYNEIPSNSNNGAFISALNTMAHTLDSSGRFTDGETDQNGANDQINTAPNAANYHQYYGWYSGDPSSMASEMQSLHNANPTDPIGIGEFGAGASDYQFTNNIVVPPDATVSVSHPENVQTTAIEEQYAFVSTQTYLYDNIVWQMFDMSSSTRKEGDTAGINDKGLVTRNRQNYKDAYYFYQANWNSPTSTRGYNTTPVIWISDHQWTDRDGSSTVPLTVYSNMGAPSLTLNGGAPVTLVPLVLDGITIPDTYSTTSASIILLPGNNMIQVSGTVNGHTYFNSDVWTYHAPSLGGKPYASIEFTTSSSNVQSGFSADTGGAFGVQSNGATYGWVQPVAEVDTFTPGGTIAIGDVDTITLPGGHLVQYTVVAGGTTPASVAFGLASAWDVDPVAQTLGSAAITGSGSLTITAAATNTSMQLASSVAGAGTLTRAITTPGSANPSANTSGTYDRTAVTTAPFNSLSAQTGIILNPANQWQYQLPNGQYDLEIVGADSSINDMVDNLLVNGTLLHSTTFNTSGGEYQSFYDTVTVTNGLLTVSGGPGMVFPVGNIPTTQGRLSSIVIDQIAAQIGTTTTVVSNAASPTDSQPVTFTATVTPNASSGETGTVQFDIDGTSVGSAAPLNGNSASFTAVSLTGGTHSVVAIYSGDANFSSSTSAPFTQNVVSGPATKLAFIQQPVFFDHLGNPISPAVTVAVKDAAGSTITTDHSSVTLTLNGGTFSGGGTTVTVAAVNGVATFSNLIAASVGNFTLSAGDGALAGAVSNVFSVENSLLVNFNNGATDLTGQLVQNADINNVATPGGTDLSWQAAAGVTDQAGATTAGGGLLYGSGSNTDESTIYTPATFDLADGSVHTLSEFVTATPVGGKILQLGFITSKTSSFNNNYSFISARLYGDYHAEIQYNNGTATGPTLGTTAVPSGVTTGDWLQLIMTIQETAAGSGIFTGTFSVQDYGQKGNSTPTVIIAPVAYTTPALSTLAAAASAMYAGWRVGLSGTPGNPLEYDNFAVDYNLPPVVTTLGTPSGPTGGRTSVVINGSGFAGITGVTFGGVAATSFIVNSPTQITAVSPAGYLGAVDVQVSNANGVSATQTGDQFTYAPATWTGAADGKSWNIAGNWSDDLVPITGDDVAIGGGFGNIQISGGGFAGYSLTSSSPIEITSGSTLTLSGSSSIGDGITIDATAKLALAGVGNLLAVNGLNILSGGTLDIGNSFLDIENATLGAISSEVAPGFNHGAWTGSGITSSFAASDTAHLTAVGEILNNDGKGNPIYGNTAPLGLFGGSSPALNDLLVTLTYYGDANLSGRDDGSDYALIDFGFTNKLTGWYNGDFNYDGVVNGSDYTLADNAFNRQGISLNSRIATPAGLVASPVPDAGESVSTPEVPLTHVAAFLQGNVYVSQLRGDPLISQSEPRSYSAVRRKIAAHHPYTSNPSPFSRVQILLDQIVIGSVEYHKSN